MLTADDDDDDGIDVYGDDYCDDSYDDYHGYYFEAEELYFELPYHRVEVETRVRIYRPPKPTNDNY